MSERITGYILLISGVLVILFAAFSMIFVFTKRAEPIKPFNFSGISIDPAQIAPQPDFSSIPGLRIPERTVPQKMELISADMLNTSANIFAHLMFMGFLVTVGGRIASLGTNLLRPIVVKSNEKTLETEVS